MQFNFWWFTSDSSTNIIIATAIWFVLFIVCGKACQRDQPTTGLMYIGYAIASFGAGWYSVLGIWGGLVGPMIALIGFIIAVYGQRRAMT